jgi:hypothetical protein
MGLVHEPERSRADRRFGKVGLRITSRFGEQVPGDVLVDQLVVGDVVAERADQVVAVAPRLRHREVELVTHRLGVADEVEPVAREALPECQGRQHRVDDVGAGELVTAGIGHEGMDRLDGRRKSRQVEGEPAQPRFSRSRGCCVEPCVLELGSDEPVDGVLREARVLDVRRFDGGGCIPAPVGRAARVEVERGTVIGAGGRSRLIGPVGPVLDPVLEDRELVGRELPLGGHGEVCVLAACGLDHQALVGLTRDQRGTTRATSADEVPVVQAEPRLLLLRSVALDASGHEQRAHGALEPVRPHVLRGDRGDEQQRCGDRSPATVVHGERAATRWSAAGIFYGPVRGVTRRGGYRPPGTQARWKTDARCSLSKARSPW